jgi:hypothetical protein
MGKQSTRAPVRSAGVVGTARREGDAGNGGDPFRTRAATSTPPGERRSGRESDGAIVPRKPGNAGGGKGPDF